MPGCSGLFLFRHDSVFRQVLNRHWYGTLRGGVLPLRTFGTGFISVVTASAFGAKENGGLGLSGVSVGLGWVGFVSASVPVSTVGVLYMTYPVFTLIIGWIWFRDVPSKSRSLDGSHGGADCKLTGRGRTPTPTRHAYLIDGAHHLSVSGLTLHT